MQMFTIVLINETVKEDKNIGVLETTYHLIHELIFLLSWFIENMIQNASGIFSKLTFTPTTKDNKRNCNE